jgi:NADH:ubiquinone oxidoreductase subunit F (NADH-binding)
VGEENSKKDIYGPVVEQGIQRIRTKQELWNLYEDFDVVAVITKERLKWIGHLVRMDHGRVVKKISDSKLEGRRKMGRPTLRWLEEAAKDL